MPHVVILGANGQLGTDLRGVLRAARVTGLTHADLDVCDTTRAREVLGGLRPDVLINTTAFHKVDVCEDEPAMSFAVNASAVYGLALLARDLGSTFIHFSSDYVFDGSARSPYPEDALPGPLNVYGVSKLAGEYLTRRFCPRHYVIRTTGLYGRRRGKRERWQLRRDDDPLGKERQSGSCRGQPGRHADGNR